MIDGRTTLIAHIGYPTESFKAPLIYNPWFDKTEINAVVVPMAVTAEDYPDVFGSLFRLRISDETKSETVLYLFRNPSFE